MAKKYIFCRILPSVKRSFSLAKLQRAGCKWNCSPQHDFMKTIFPYEINLYNLTLYIDNNDNHMTFVRNIVYLC